MSEREPHRLLAVGSPWPAPDPTRFALESASDAAAALLCFEAEGAGADAVLLDGDAAVPAPLELAGLAERAALVVVVREPEAEHAGSWLRRGAADVLGRDELDTPAGWRRLRFAIERRRAALEREPQFSTDLGTGLPHRQQLIEHLSHLLALREREPSPMAVLAIRVEGLGPHAEAGAEGAAEADVLRRKIAVRLRAAVRASDVVAAVDDAVYAVLLGSILAPGDAARVADKLVAAVIEPLSVGGQARSVAAAIGIARYPQDGKDAERLLRRAAALAAVAPAAGQAGPAAAHDAQGGERVAANDEG